MTLTAAGWIFLVTAWSAILALTGWTMYEVLYASERRKKKGSGEAGAGKEP